MDKYNKSINILIEDILNEAKSAHIKSYDRSKKVYDEAFKKGLPIWEKKANSKGYAPCKHAEALKFFKKRIDFKDEYTKIKELEKITIGKWTLLIGERVRTPAPMYMKGGIINQCYVIVKKPNGKCALRSYPYKKFLDWSKVSDK